MNNKSAFLIPMILVPTIILVLLAPISHVYHLDLEISNNYAENMYNQDLESLRNDLNFAEVYCQLHGNNQEMEILLESIQSENPKERYEQLKVFPKIACKYDLREIRLNISRLKMFRSQMIEKYKNEQ